MELDAFLQIKGVNKAVIADSPFLGQYRRDFACVVDIGKGLVHLVCEVHVDIGGCTCTMRIKRGPRIFDIDDDIVALFTRSLATAFIARSAGIAAAAKGQNGNQQKHRQEQRQLLFHVFSFFLCKNYNQTDFSASLSVYKNQSTTLLAYHYTSNLFMAIIHFFVNAIKKYDNVKIAKFFS